MGLDLVSCGRTAVTEVEERGGALFKDWICGRDGEEEGGGVSTYVWRGPGSVSDLRFTFPETSVK